MYENMVLDTDLHKKIIHNHCHAVIPTPLFLLKRNARVVKGNEE